ncbi:hypothetical protein BBK14_22600 [Parafrankia soli]|uniref:Uncharacterized protein n=1 Tax=Parafrankia soli TaxID=2599596 RepID=A0A1S1PV91_9ACTN|nr:hypothetical protein [Parafrankia soli]OHV25161.1 hypothetical protein BBK14_22600 [Parafrankia soli]
MFRSLLSALEELTLLVLPHGGQRTARHNAWRAATDLHVTTGYRWVDQISVSALEPSLAPPPAPPARATFPVPRISAPRVSPVRSRAAAAARS